MNNLFSKGFDNHHENMDVEEKINSEKIKKYSTNEIEVTEGHDDEAREDLSLNRKGVKKSLKQQQAENNSQQISLKLED